MTIHDLSRILAELRNAGQLTPSVERMNSGAMRGFIRGVPCNDGLAGCPLRSPAELKGMV